MITVYTKPECVQCEYTKKVLDKAGLEYETLDVTTDQAAADAVKALNYNGVPVVVVDDGRHWTGFRIDKLRGLKGVK